MQCPDIGAARWEKQVRTEREQFRNVSAHEFAIAGAPPAIVDAQVGTFGPAQLLKCLLESAIASLNFRIGFEATGEYADPPHPLLGSRD